MDQRLWRIMKMITKLILLVKIQNLDLALLNHLLLVGDNLGSDLLTGQQLKCREDQTVKGLAGLAGDALPLLTVLTGLGPLYLLAENSTENMSLECWEEGMVN